MDSKGKIILVEDEKSLMNTIELNLKMEGFDVVCIANGQEAIDFAPQINQYDLVILDVMLPEVSGWDICSAYKKVSNIPILFMSAKSSSSDKIKGLKLGADDYLAKPFDLEELLLRVQVLVLRNKELEDDIKQLTIGDCMVDLLTYEVIKQNKVISELSKREIELLALFNAHEGQVLARDLILDELWGENAFPTARTIDNYILTFRKLFEKDPKNPKFFHSIRGVGYKYTNLIQ